MMPLFLPGKTFKQNKKLINNTELINELSEIEKNLRLENVITNSNNKIVHNIIENSQNHEQSNSKKIVFYSTSLPSRFGNASTSTSITVNNEICEYTKPSLSTNFQNENNNNNNSEASSISNSPSFSLCFGEKLSVVAGKISLKLNGFHNNFTSQKLNSEQCAEKVLLVPTFIDNKTIGNTTCHDSSLNVKFIDDNLMKNSTYDRQCRICLMQSTSDKKGYWKNKKLIAPCRCSGTVQYVHLACLTHWIEVSSRKMYSVPKCELCGYKFRQKPLIDFTRIHFPYVDWCDRILNCLFIFLLAIMILCAWVAIYYLRIAEHKPLSRPSRNPNTKRFLTDNNVTVVIASILFFAAFFIALFTQYRAEVTVFRILSRMWVTNRNWRIRNYDSNLDGNDGENKLNFNSKTISPEVSRTQI